MTRLIAFASQKGGVGKTTSAVNIACGWARAAGSGKVLLIDLDPQANATAVLLGVAAAAGPRIQGVHTVKELLLEEASASATIQSVTLPAIKLKSSQAYDEVQLDMMPSHLELAMIEPLLNTRFMGEYRLRKGMAEIQSQYDVIIVDCPPSLGALTLNALLFCREIIVPIDPGLFPMIGFALLEKTVEQARQINTDLRIAGVVPTMIDKTNVAHDTLEQLKIHYGDILLPAIPRRTIVGEATSSAQDVLTYAPTSTGAQAYVKLLDALIEQGVS
ncbi:MAG: ParA family protein [Candidatus Promineifilaceae bacterium]